MTRFVNLSSVKAVRKVEDNLVEEKIILCLYLLLIYSSCFHIYYTADNVLKTDTVKCF